MLNCAAWGKMNKICTGWGKKEEQRWQLLLALRGSQTLTDPMLSYVTHYISLKRCNQLNDDDGGEW